MTPSTQSYFKEPEFREEGGTPNIVGCIRAGLAMQLKEVSEFLLEPTHCKKMVIRRWAVTILWNGKNRLLSLVCSTVVLVATAIFYSLQACGG